MFFIIHKFLGITFLIIILFSCNNTSNNEKELINKNNEKDSLILLWKQDSLGCNKFRNIRITEVLFTKYKLKNRDFNEVIDLLGNPNVFIKETEKTYGELCYYCNTICTLNKINNDSDKTWISFLIEKNKIIKFQLITN